MVSSLKLLSKKNGFVSQALEFDRSEMPCKEHPWHQPGQHLHFDCILPAIRNIRNIPCRCCCWKGQCIDFLLGDCSQSSVWLDELCCFLKEKHILRKFLQQPCWDHLWFTAGLHENISMTLDSSPEAGLFYFLSPVLSESMASREKDLDTDDSMIHFGDPRKYFPMYPKNTFSEG